MMWHCLSACRLATQQAVQRCAVIGVWQRLALPLHGVSRAAVQSVSRSPVIVCNLCAGTLTMPVDEISAEQLSEGGRSVGISP